MTKAMATKASQPQIAFLRCWALQRPARAAKVFECMAEQCRSCAPCHAIRATGVLGVGVALRPRNDMLVINSTERSPACDARPRLVDALAAARERTFALVAHLDDEQLERQIDPIMSPLVWDLAHIAAYEDLWLVHRLARRAAAAPRARRASTTRSRRRAPCAARSSCSTPAGAREYLAEVRERTLARASTRAASTRWCTRWSCATSSSTPRRCARRCALGGLLRARASRRLRPVNGGRAVASGSTSPPGRCALGAADDGFAYDNERPRHARRARRLPDRPPAGHQRDVAALRRGRRLPAPRVVDATRAGRGRRTTTSRTTVRTQTRGRTRTLPVVPRLLVRGRRLRPRARRPAPHRSGVGEGGDLGPKEDLAGHRAGLGVDRVEFDGYPGFVAHPYREYSEVFFGARLPRAARRLVGDATRASPPRRFRNWDLPQRRQIFAGVRLATDAEER